MVFFCFRYLIRVETDLFFLCFSWRRSMNVCACVFAMPFLQRGWLQLLGKVRSPSLAVPRYPDQQPASAALTDAAVI